MKKDGFTLIELLGAIVILATLLLLAFPPILNQIQKSKNQLSGAMKELIYGAGDSYLAQNKNAYPKKNGNVYCITLKQLSESGLLNNPLVDPGTGKEISLSKFVTVKVDNAIFKLELTDTCTEIKNTET